MSFSIHAQRLSGIYGTENDCGDIIHLQIQDTSDGIYTKNKEVILVIDLSGSMSDSLPALKSSLLALRDSLCGKSYEEMSELSKQDRDTLFRSIIKVKLITFSNTANIIWTHDSTEYFDDVVRKLQTQSTTNMGAGIELAFRETNPEMYTWIIVMTDGESNKGSHRTVSSFQRLVSRDQPYNSRIMALGYGQEFNPEVLNNIGQFIYVEDEECIPIVLGNIVDEIIRSTKFNLIIDIDTDVEDDTIIVPADSPNSKTGQIIVGSRVLGPIVNHKTYNYIYLPYGNNIDSTRIQDYNSVNVTYFNTETREEVNVKVQIIDGTHISSTIQKLFFEEESRRIIYSLYKHLQGNNSVRLCEEVARINKVVREWPDLASEYKEEILLLLEKIDTTDYRHITRLTLNTCIGSSYTDKSNLSDMTSISCMHYMSTPDIKMSSHLTKSPI